nr:retrotransposon protein, putative, Ty3-gypsy subclass [Tanacetum cinerariifolium]GEV85664.1 retrotransposon protein, putative, Ty3-gypsy subclass [Tanacetum cinerariifolium]
MTESPLVDSGFAVPVFFPGDDPISCLNKAMDFLRAVASLRGDKGKVILVLVIRVMLLVLGETMQVDMQGLLNATTVKTKDLDTYDSDCDDISNAKAVLMANISNYGSAAVSEIRNEDLRIELEYFSEDYDKERDMEPRPEPRREATPTLRLRSLGVHRQRERVVRFEDAPNKEENRKGRNAKGIRPSEIKAREDKLRISLSRPRWVIPLLGAPSLSSSRRPMYAPPNMPAYPNPAEPFTDFTGSITHFVCWIDDYPLPDGLKMPSHIGSYDGKGDPDNFLHLFEGAIRMQKWLMPVAYYMFTYTLKDSTRIWWNSQKTGRTAMQRMGIVVSTIHEAIKFHTEKGIETVLSTDGSNKGTKRAKKIHAKSKERVLSCVNDKEKIIVNTKYPDQTVTIGKQLPDYFKKELQNLLKSNANVFAWTHADMTGIPRTIMILGNPFNTEHKLNECSHIKPIKQNKRGLGPDRSMAAYKEIKELTKAGILLKAKRHTWVANPVMVKKSDGGWRMGNIPKVSGQGLQSPNWKNLKAYIDDMLNPKKCSFGVEEGPILGHLITKNGIKANPSKVKAVTNLDQPSSLKDIQSLNGKLAALSQFLSKGAERSLAFFKVLKGCKDKKSIQWTTEVDKALEKMKKLIQTLPTLTSPRVGETLSMHLTALKESIEYEALLAGLWIAQELEIAKVAIFLDSQLLVNQIKSTLTAKQASIKGYLQKVKNALRGFEDYIVKYVRKNHNKKADALSKLASMTFEYLTKEVLAEVLTKRSIEEKEVLEVETHKRKSWMDPIHEYLLSGLFPEDTREARKIRIQAPQYKLI